MTKHPTVQNLDRTFGWVTLCVLIYALATAWYSWRDEKADYLSTLTTVTALEAKALDNYLSHLESDLRELGEDLTQQGDRIDLAHAYTLVKRFKEVHSELFNVTLISPTGQVLLTAKNPPGTSTATLAKDPSFMAFLGEMQQGKASSIGQPLVSVINKVAIVPVRHALKDRKGNLIYIVSANLPHEHLRSFWEDAPITSKAAIGLMRDNGYLLSRFPVPAGMSLEQVYGRPRTGALINHLQKEGFPENGHIQGQSSLDGPDFLNTFRRLPHHPVTLFVAMPMSEVRARWMERVSTTYIAILFLSLGGFAAYRYARRRQLAWNADQSRLEEVKQRSAKELLASETRFRTLFAHNNAIILQIEPVTGKILDANAAASQFYGWSHNELLSKSIQDINQLDAEQIAAERQAAVQEHRSYFVFPHLLANGDIRTVEVHSTPIEVGGKTVLISIIHDITDRAVIEERVRVLLEEQKAILDSDLIGIVKVQERKILWANDTFHTLLGYSRGELVGQPTRVCYPTDESHALFGAGAYPVFHTGNAYRTELQLRRKDGNLGWYSLRTAPLRSGGDVLIGVLIDITNQILGAEKIDALMREQKAILNNELVGIVTVRDRRIVWANPAFEHMLGYQTGDLAGTLTRQNYPSEEAFQAFGDAAYPALAAGTVFRAQTEHVRNDGQRIWLDASGSLLSSATGESLWCFIDVTERERNQREIEHLAFYDILTALPNRRLLLDRLSQAIIANKRSDRHGAVVFLDLDNFKSLNDTHGHGVGDLLLLEVAERLKGCVRQIDTVSRFGGDEFVVLLCDLASDKVESTSLANIIAEKIRTKLAEPYVLTVEPQGKVPIRVEHRCTASIGVIVFASDELSQDEILKSADVAMYQAKDAGRNSIRFHVGLPGVGKTSNLPSQ